MNIDPKIQFEKRYEKALKRHLRLQPGPQPCIAARLLGRLAVLLGMDTLDLARVHDKAVAGRDPPSARDNPQTDTPPPDRANVFFLAAAAPIERTHAAAQAAALFERQTDIKLRAGRVALTAARLRTRTEIAQRKQYEAKLIERIRDCKLLIAQSRRLAHQLLSAQEDERKEISRELHDEVAQILAGINVQLAALQEASVIDGRGLRQRIALTQRLVGQSVRIVHRYARELRPAMLDDLGLIPTLRSYIRDLPTRKKPNIRFTAFPGVERFSNLRRTVLYRVAQEALTNVLRHAQATNVKVSIRKIGGDICLEICDDGKSFPVNRILSAKNNKHLGLIGMRERVEMVGGTFAVESTPGKGTTVWAKIPLNEKQTGANP